MTTPINRVNGIGPKTTEYLKKRRITTVEALIKRGTSVLEVAPGFSPGRATSVIKEASKVLSGSSSKVKIKSEKSGKKDKKNKK